MNYTETIIDVSNQGYGVCKLDGLTVFVKGALLDEEVSFKIIKKKKSFAIAEIEEIIKASPYRNSEKQTDSAPLYHWDYQHQIEFKNKIVETTFKDFLSSEVDYQPIVAQDNPFNYRNKAQLPLMNKEGKIVLAEFVEGSNDLVPLENMNLYDKRIIAAAEVVIELMQLNKMEAFDRKTKKGNFKHLIIRTSQKNDDLMVVLIANKKLDLKPEFMADLLKRLPQLKSVILNVHNEKNSLIFGKHSKVIYGEDQYIDHLMGLDFLISSQSFYQINSQQTEALYNIALSHLSETDVMMDAYCGIGTISLLAAKKVQEVVGVEINEDAVAMAKKNRTLNSIENVQFLKGPVDSYLSVLEEVDTLLVDPPRAGLSQTLIQSVIESQIEKIVYVSCDPITLRRDLNLLQDTFSVDSLQAVDMFPHTPHIETVVKLVRK